METPPILPAVLQSIVLQAAEDSVALQPIMAQAILRSRLKQRVIIGVSIGIVLIVGALLILFKIV